MLHDCKIFVVCFLNRICTCRPTNKQFDPFELDKRAMRDSARDMYLLSLADIHIISDESGFGLMGSILRPRHKYIIIAMNKDASFTRNCSAIVDNGGDPLSKFAHQWSGLRQ